jgi:branched-chain amino acid transport system ATP-binding protein
MSLLRVDELVVRYGAITALHGISLEIEEDEMVTLIGANGAGKSTALWSIVGQIGEMGGRIASGNVSFRGRDLSRVKPSAMVAELGVVLVPEGRRTFGNLTVLENLRLAAFARRDAAGVAADLDRIFEIFPRLQERGGHLADLLSGGEQQMLAVGRAIMARPRLMLLDEPSMGLAPVLVQALFRTLDEINRSGVAMLLVEQNANMALKHATRAYVLESGTIALHGPAGEVAADPRVRQSYLGGDL